MMAEVRLGRHTADEEDLPDVCLKGGAPTTRRRMKTFSWHPPWIFVLLLVHVLVYLIVALIVTKRRRVSAPLCAKHKNHWIGRSVLLGVSFLALAALGIASVVALSNAG